MTVAEQVDLGGKTAAGTPQGVVLGFLGISSFPPPAAHRAAGLGAVDAPQLVVDQPGIDAGGPQSGEDRSRVPSFFHVSKRSQTVAQGPSSPGRPRAGGPSEIKRMASTI